MKLVIIQLKKTNEKKTLKRLAFFTIWALKMSIIFPNPRVCHPSINIFWQTPFPCFWESKKRFFEPFLWNGFSDSFDLLDDLISIFWPLSFLSVLCNSALLDFVEKIFTFIEIRSFRTQSTIHPWTLTSFKWLSDFDGSSVSFSSSRGCYVYLSSSRLVFLRDPNL